MSGMERLAAVLSRRDRRYQPALATGVLGPITVTRDSKREVIAASGPLDGDGAFDLSLKGHPAANDGEYLLVGYPADRPVGAELSYLGKVGADVPTGKIVNGNFPAPTLAAVPWTTGIVKLPGSITAKGSVFFEAVEERFGPSEYIVSFRVDGDEWADRKVPHLGGTQECSLGSDLPPSADVDVHLSAFYAWASAESPPTADSTYQTADDNSSPGAVTAIAVNLDTPGVLSMKLTVSTDSDLLLGYIYLVRNTTSGVVITSVPLPAQWDAHLPPATYEVAAYPISKAGTAGSRQPSSGYQGPYTVIDQSANLDTTAPAVINTPTLATRTVQFADNTWHGFLTVTRPSYSPPADLAAYEISIVVSDGRAFVVEIPAGTTVWDGEVGFGTFTVGMRGRDQAGNRPAFGTTSAATIAAPALSNTAPTVGTTTVGAGIKVTWNRIAGALGYEVQRATDNLGTGAATIATVDSLWYFDPLIADNLILPTYFYRVRPVSMQNGSVIQGTYSSWVTGTVGAIDAQNLRVLSIVAGLIATDAITANKILAGAVTAAKLEADLILATKIRTATSGTRWEQEGHTGGGAQDQIRFIEAISGVDKKRIQIDGTGFYVYNDASAQEGKFYRDSTTHARFSLGVNSTYGTPAIDIRWDTTLGLWLSVMDIYRSAMRFAANGKNVLIRDGGSAAGYSSIPQFFKETTANGDPVIQVSEQSGNVMSVFPNGFEVFISPNAYALNASAYGWFAGGGLHANLMPDATTSAYPLTARPTAALGTTLANLQNIQGWQYIADTADVMTLRLRAYRGGPTALTGYNGARFRLSADVANESIVAGGLDLGFRDANGYFSLTIAGAAKLYWDAGSTRVLIPDNLRVDGSISKGSGTFDIPHPDPDKDADGVRLRHSLVESPTRGDNLYRFAVLVAEDQVEQEIATDLPDYFRWLNEGGQCWVSPRRNFGRAWAEVDAKGRTFTLAADRPGWYEVLIVATRKDATAVRGWDETGGIEPLANDSDRERQHKRRDSLGRKIAPRTVAV